MQPWQQRVIEEHNELDKKIDKLETFIKTMDDTNRVAYQDWQLLEAQLHAMRAYRQILSIRSSKF